MGKHHRKIESLILVTLSLKCLLNIEMEILRRELDIRIWNSGEWCKLERNLGSVDTEMVFKAMRLVEITRRVSIENAKD